LNSDEWEVWGCNSLWYRTRDAHDRFRADRWFELHPFSVQTDKEMEAIRDCPVPIYLLPEAQYPKNGVLFPLDWVKQQLHFPFDFFACTFAYQVALAIAEGFKEIGIFGTELMYGTPRERLFELRSLEFWLGLAMGRGIIVHFHPQSRLCRLPYKYGYDYDAEMLWCAQKAEFLSLMQNANNEREKQFSQEDIVQWYHREAAKEQDEFFHGEEAPP
jgi:hypothetical protein